ncbi:MAG: 2-C-methyl-D-erythritol 4-phosphate cytidylyltransferase, partial [Pseudomonadota bacterium]|nr:2-C-methyl-D-erythritol 4-phosphate cytidylyltransferase [Pseudomonadota bacterium]
MGAALPKQYLSLAGQPMLQHVLETCAAAKILFHTYVVVASSDRWIDSLWVAAPHLRARVSVVRCGGETRQQSVANGLAAIRAEIDDTDWVLVHDAARPGLTVALIERLIDAVGDDAVGGLLAMPLADTVKRADAQQRVDATVDRAGLW